MSVTVVKKGLLIEAWHVSATTTLYQGTLFSKFPFILSTINSLAEATLEKRVPCELILGPHMLLPNMLVTEYAIAKYLE